MCGYRGHSGRSLGAGRAVICPGSPVCYAGRPELHFGNHESFSRMTGHCYIVHYSESPKCYFDWWCSDGTGCYTGRNDPFSGGAGDEGSLVAVGGPEDTATWKEGVQGP